MLAERGAGAGQQVRPGRRGAVPRSVLRLVPEAGRVKQAPQESAERLGPGRNLGPAAGGQRGGQQDQQTLGEAGVGDRAGPVPRGPVHGRQRRLKDRWLRGGSQQRHRHTRIPTQNWEENSCSRTGRAGSWCGGQGCRYSCLQNPNRVPWASSQQKTRNWLRQRGDRRKACRSGP